MGSACWSTRSASRSSATTRPDDECDQVLDKLRRPDVDAVSIKASALVANLDVLDFDRSVERICEPCARSIAPRC